MGIKSFQISDNSFEMSNSRPKSFRAIKPSRSKGKEKKTKSIKGSLHVETSILTPNSNGSTHQQGLKDGMNTSYVGALEPQCFNSEGPRVFRLYDNLNSVPWYRRSGRDLFLFVIASILMSIMWYLGFADSSILKHGFSIVSCVCFTRIIMELNSLRSEAQAKASTDCFVTSDSEDFSSSVHKGAKQEKAPIVNAKKANDSSNLSNDMTSFRNNAAENRQRHGGNMGSEKSLEICIAEKGNGNNEDIDENQRQLIESLLERTASHAEALATTLPTEALFCNRDTCRRYLVGNSWNIDKAETQLVSTLKWRTETNPAGLHFHESPKASVNPNALSMRIVGLDKEGRPVCYTSFAESVDRWNIKANLTHMRLLMESCTKVLNKRCANGYNRSADSRQWIWVIDFDGFGWRDQNPNVARITINLMQHYPEMLNLAVLINSPGLFRGVWAMIKPVLEARTAEKVLFVKLQDFDEKLVPRIGLEMAEWVRNEVADNMLKRPQAKKGNLKKYWIPPENESDHDSRGLKSYVNSEYYIKTPGDAFLEKQKSNT